MTRNSKVLEDFTRYCIEHPEERFWQALRNWSGAAGIFFADGEYCELLSDRTGDGLDDTFYWENKNN